MIYHLNYYKNSFPKSQHITLINQNFYLLINSHSYFFMKNYLLTLLFAMLMIVTGTGLSHAATPGNVHFYTFYNSGTSAFEEIPVENTNFTYNPAYGLSAKSEGCVKIVYQTATQNSDGTWNSFGSWKEAAYGNEPHIKVNSVVINSFIKQRGYRVKAYGVNAKGEKGPERTIELTCVPAEITYSPEPGTYPAGTIITVTTKYLGPKSFTIKNNGVTVETSSSDISNTYKFTLKEDSKFESKYTYILGYQFPTVTYTAQYYINKDVEIKAYVDGEEVKPTDELPEGTEVTFKAEGAAAIAYAPYSVTGSRHPNLTRVNGESVTVTVDKMHRRFFVDAYAENTEVASKEFFFNVENASYDLALHYTTYNVRDYYGAENFSTIYKPIDEHNLMDSFVEVSKNKHQLKNNDDLCGQFAISINGQEIGGDVNFKNDTFHSHLSTQATGNTSCSKNHEGYVPVSDGYTIPLHNMTFDDGVKNTKAVTMSTNPNQYHWELTLYNADKSTITVNLNPFYSANFKMDVQEGGTTGVDDIAVEEVDENAPAVYYDLNGRRVAGTPTSGLYIEVRGKKAQKVLIH